jgi:hypothetical protein
MSKHCLWPVFLNPLRQALQRRIDILVKGLVWNFRKLYSHPIQLVHGLPRFCPSGVGAFRSSTIWLIPEFRIFWRTIGHKHNNWRRYPLQQGSAAKGFIVRMGHHDHRSPQQWFE